MDDYRDTTTERQRAGADTRPGTHTSVTHTERGGSGGLWFIVGGVVVAVAVIAYFIFGAGTDPTVTPPADDAAITTEEAPAGVGDPAATPPAAVAPADEAPAEDAPVTPAPDAPATDAAPAEGGAVEEQSGN